MQDKKVAPVPRDVRAAETPSVGPMLNGKETGPLIGKLKGQLKSAGDSEAAGLQAQIKELETRPAALKQQIHELDGSLAAIEPEWKTIQLQVPQPPDEDVPRGVSADDNVEIRRWAPEGWDWNKSFEENRGFTPKSHLELVNEIAKSSINTCKVTQ